MPTQHTPGPWKVAEAFINNQPNRLFVSEGKWGGKNIADLGEADEANNANARLIAAAPELLAALQSLIQYLPEEDIYYEDASSYRQIQRAVERAEAAIARATQQP